MELDEAEEIYNDLMRPEANWLLSNGVDSLIDLEKVIALMNLIKDDQVEAFRGIHSALSLTKVSYAKLAEAERDVRLQRDAVYDRIVYEALQKDSAASKICSGKVTVAFAERHASQDDSYIYFNEQLQVLKSKKERVGSIIGLLELQIQTMQNINSARDEIRASGQVIEVEEIRELISKFR